MPINDFAKFYFSPISDIISKERRKGVFSGDFNINLLGLGFNEKREIGKFIQHFNTHPNYKFN